jgi:integrase/recombinase XerC
VDFDTKQLKVTGKRNKQRIIPFGEELSQVLSHYIAVRNEQVVRKTEGALFLSDKGMRMTGEQVYQIVHKYLTAVTSLKKRSPHVLRHTFATAMLNNGAGLESIKNLLGHESVSTTEIYAHTTFEQLKRVYKEAHPRA